MIGASITIIPTFPTTSFPSPVRLLNAAAHNPTFRTRTRTRTRIASVCGASIAQPTSLLDWLIEHQGATPDSLLVQRVHYGEHRGWGLSAVADALPGEVLLSVPIPAAITSEGSLEESLWSVHMASRFLHALETASIQPWADTLPQHVPLPWLYWPESTITELQDPDTVQEALRLRGVFEKAVEMMPEFSPDRVAWALSLVHSRSFLSNGHVWVPGIDLCNHSWRPNATVRCVRSPGAAQGVAALEEIAPLPTEQEPSLFQLIAGEGGIKSGEEICISYGSWPNDVLLLFFGWVDDDNPHDAVALFTDVLELDSFHARLVDGHPDCTQSLRRLEDSLQLPLDSYARMVVTAQGLDGRLIEAVNAALRSRPPAAGQAPLSLSEFIKKRCMEALEAFPTTIEEDVALLHDLGAVEGEELQTAVRYRVAKKRTLHAVLRQMQRGQ